MQDAIIYLKEDTIVALSTPSGRGAIAVIRLSGPEAIPVTEKVFTSRSGNGLSTPRMMVHGYVRDPGNDERIDDVLCVGFRAPSSYTGEDMCELHCHSSEAVIRRVLHLFHEKGIRLAEPGEFTFRAVRNGKLDLAQAEAISSLIDSRSQMARALSMRMLEGAFSKNLAIVKDRIIEILCEIETQIEFPDDAEDDTIGKHLSAKALVILEDVRTLQTRAVREQRFEQGVVVVLAGRPNVGKSSLFNRLLGRERAIVTPHPGTTRDSIEGTIELAGRPVTLIDTAGLRETQEEIEAIGVKRSQELLSTSHLILYVVEAGANPSLEDQAILEDIIKKDRQGRLILVKNKTDLLQGQPGWPSVPDYPNVISIMASAEEDGGIESLLTCLETEICEMVPADAESSFLINTRQDQVLGDLVRHIEQGVNLLSETAPLEMSAEEFRGGLRSIAKLDGTGIVPNIMHTIFGRFCIGK
jgi:tRNA modification GTPase